MYVPLTDSETRLAQLIQAVENGERYLHHERWRTVAELGPPRRGKVMLGTMRDRIKLLPGWDDPIEERIC